MLTPNPKKFGTLLTDGIYTIKACERLSIAQIEDELGYAINREGGSCVSFWRRGNVPTSHSEVEALAREIVKRGNLERRWLEDFLNAAGLYSDVLSHELFPSNDHQSEKQTVTTYLLSKVPLPNRAYSIFIDRLDELQILSNWLQTPAVRIVTISGFSGIGKTSLSVEVSLRNAQQFPDGIIHIRLRELIPFDLRSLALAILTKLFGHKPEFGEHPTSALEYYLQNLAILLILDDLQTAPSDTLQKLIAQLRNQLPESGRSKAIMISHRQMAELAGWHFARHLSVTRGFEFAPFLKLVEYHAQITRSNLNLTDIRKVFDAVRGHPKLLELAMGKAKGSNWGQVLKFVPHMRDDFIYTRMINAFSELLPTHVQTVLQSISALPTITGTFEEIHAINADTPDVFTYLEQLVEAHLVDLRADTNLYSIHQLIADANADSMDLECATSPFFQSRLKLAHFYIQQLESNIAAVSAETILLDNAVGIVRWCAENSLQDIHVRLTLALVESLKAKGIYTETISLLSSALHSAQTLGQNNYIADLQFYLGEFLYQVGDLQACANTFKIYVCSFPEELTKRAEALHRLAILHLYPRTTWYCRLDAVALLEECYQLWISLDKQLQAAYALNDLGYELFCRGEHKRAAQLIQESFEVAQQLHKNRPTDFQIWGIILRTTAIYHRECKELEMAKLYYDQSIDALEQVDDVKELADTYISYAHTCELLEDFDVAIASLSNAQQLLKRFGPSLVLAQAWLYLGEVYTLQNTAVSLDKAAFAYKKSLEMATWLPSGEDDGILYVSQYGLGRVEARRGHWQVALEFFQTSLMLREKLGHQDGIPFVLYEMALVKANLGESGTALTLLEQVTALTNPDPHPKGQALYQQTQTMQRQIANGINASKAKINPNNMVSYTP